MQRIDFQPLYSLSQWKDAVRTNKKNFIGIWLPSGVTEKEYNLQIRPRGTSLILYVKRPVVMTYTVLLPNYQLNKPEKEGAKNCTTPK